MNRHEFGNEKNDKIDYMVQQKLSINFIATVRFGVLYRVFVLVLR